MSRNEYGAWIPWPVVERAVRLRFRPASRSAVFWLLLATSCRFNRQEARLSIREIAARTGLSERTVKAAVADLVRAGHVRRQGRYRKLIVTIVEEVPGAAATETELSIPGGQHHAGVHGAEVRLRTG